MWDPGNVSGPEVWEFKGCRGSENPGVACGGAVLQHYI